MTVTNAKPRPRLINARGVNMRPLVESMAVDSASKDMIPGAAAGGQWSDPQHAATVIGAIERICGSKKLTDQQRIPEIQKILKLAEQTARQAQANPATPLHESSMSELIEAQQSADSPKTLIVPGRGTVTFPTAWGAIKRAVSKVRLIQRSHG
jgi:hypothetical protein